MRGVRGVLFLDYVRMPCAQKSVAWKQSAAGTAASARLTPRETEILSLLAKGFLYKEIADQLKISLHTVRGHRSRPTRSCAWRR